MRRWSRPRVAGVGVAAAALVLAGCGGSGGDGDPAGPEGGAAATEVREPGGGGGSEKLPAALAANREQANEILDEGKPALDEKLAELEGHPVVVNQWGSWCPPCRAEFPHFQRAAEEYKDEVAFLGIDMQDERGAAERFLSELPVPYPSIWDPAAEAITSIGGGVVSPTTSFIDEEGEVVHVFQGEYTSLAQLREAIEVNLLGGGGTG